jgi:uncharacterized protein (TIGR02996 family)
MEEGFFDHAKLSSDISRGNAAARAAKAEKSPSCQLQTLAAKSTNVHDDERDGFQKGRNRGRSRRAEWDPGFGSCSARRDLPQTGSSIMDSRKAFLQDIADNPDDDGLRLIFADWLTEQDDPRGEFIRLQVRLASLSSRGPCWTELKVRERELWQAHQEEWEAPLRGLARRWEFRRGFPEAVELTVPEFLERGENLLNAVPVVGARLVRASSQLHLLQGFPALNRLRSLSLSYGFVNDAAAHSLSRLSNLEGLRVLLLDHNFIRTAGAEMLARSESLGSLQRLDLCGNQIGAAGRNALADRFGAGVRFS